MLVTRTFKPTNGSRVHVIHESKTGLHAGFLTSLCGKQFAATCKVWANRAGTCPICMKLDNPFELTRIDVLKVFRVLKHTVEAGSLDGLYRRDLVNFITNELTPKGRVVVADVDEHVPWPDKHGVVHSRDSITFRGGSCGADLDGVDTMTYVKLDKMLALRKTIRVTCLECLVED